MSIKMWVKSERRIKCLKRRQTVAGRKEKEERVIKCVHYKTSYKTLWNNQEVNNS